ncbi:DNA-binding CsgD family transcriptional regulator [Salinicoccus halitifaciens]|uniref:DNA-binding CsgD family transcriptional regulator n=2 Tax=Salinicoccus halitifaciens TaxID=1073415 RepID=A0ABV2E8Z0_9STAP|nr:response regulator transcription factor [Salinicoccus halitifaciens]
MKGRETMVSAIELIEKVQMTFATQYGLTFFLTDEKGEVIASAEDDNLLSKTLLQQEDGLLPEIRMMLKHNKRLHKTLTYEIQSGLHMMASPVSTGKGTYHYLWAGILVEQGNHTEKLLNQCGYDEDYSIPILEAENKKDWLRVVDRLAQLASVCLRHEERNPMMEIFTDGWRDSIKGSKDPVTELFSRVIDGGGDIDFMGLAEQTGEDAYTITKIKGEGTDTLQDARFLAGEGFLGRTALSGERSYWEDIDGDRRSRILSSLDKKPKCLFTDPIERHDGSISVLFGGSCFKGKVTASMKNTAQMTATLVESSRLVSGLRRENSQQLSRLSSFIDICSLMASTPDPRRMVLILLDISINLVEGSFSSVIIKDKRVDKGRLITRGTYDGDINQYVKDVMERTGHLSRFPEGEFSEPKIRVMPNGGKVIEAPLSYGSEMMGILSVGVTETGEREKQENLAFLQTLSIIGSVSLQLAGRSETGAEEEKIEALQLAVAEFDEDIYRCSKESAELAALMATQLELPSDTAQSVVQACRLSYYSPAFILKMLPDGKVAAVMRTGNAILEKNSEPEMESAGTAGYIYALCLVYTRSHNIDEAMQLETMNPEVLDIFLSLIRTTHVSEAEIDLELDSAQGDAQDIKSAVKAMENLSPREQEVLLLISEGKNNQEIAETLYISTHTVKNHITKIFNKLDVSDRVNAISKVYRNIYNR